MENKDNEAMFEEIADEAFIEERPDNEAMIEEVSDEAYIEERPDNEAMIEEVSDEVFIEERKLQPHTIYIKQPQHGLLLAYPPQAVAGETIGVRCNNNKPDEYKIKEVNVIASGTVWRMGNQRRSQTQDSNEPFESVFGNFKMPDSDVTLEAVFEKTTKEPKQSIKCPSCNTNYYKTYSKYCHHCGMKRI